MIGVPANAPRRDEPESPGPSRRPERRVPDGTWRVETPRNAPVSEVAGPVLPRPSRVGVAERPNARLGADRPPIPDVSPPSTPPPSTTPAAAPNAGPPRSTVTTPFRRPDPIGVDARNKDGVLPGAAAATALAHRRKASVSSARWILEWLFVIAIAVAVALLIKSFAFQAFRIPSDSMVPTLIKEDRVMVNKLSYRLHGVNRGDVVVFERPPNYLPNDRNAPKDLIKRVIGLPGETVDSRNGRVYVDGKPLDESEYLSAEITTTIAKPIQVPEGKVLVLGDNRNNSEDGRFFGPIDEDLIVGRAFLRMWPFNRLDWL